MKSHRDLEIHKMSLSLFYEVHPLSLKLPRYELYELGSQIRRSADSVESNIVEGYAKRHYKRNFINYLWTSYASCKETETHAVKIAHLYPNFTTEFENLQKEYDMLAAKIYSFINYVEKNWKS